MNEIQQQIFAQYIEWLFDDTAHTREALIGLKELAPPEAIDPLIRFIDFTRERYAERWTSAHYEYWNTNRSMAREALDAIYAKAGKEALELNDELIALMDERIKAALKTIFNAKDSERGE